MISKEFKKIIHVCIYSNIVGIQWYSCVSLSIYQTFSNRGNPHPNDQLSSRRVYSSNTAELAKPMACGSSGLVLQFEQHRCPDTPKHHTTPSAACFAFKALNMAEGPSIFISPPVKKANGLDHAGAICRRCSDPDQRQACYRFCESIHGSHFQCDEQHYANAMEQPTCSAGLRAEQNHPRLAAHTVVLLFLDAMLRSKNELYKHTVITVNTNRYKPIRL